MRSVMKMLVIGVLFAPICLCASDVARCKTSSVGDIVLKCDRPGVWSFTLKPSAAKDGVETVELVAESPNIATLPPFQLAFAVPRKDIHHMWDPFGERFGATWGGQYSSFSAGLPLRANFDDNENNVLTVAIADALHGLRFRTDIDLRNENAHVLGFSISFFGEPAPPMSRYSTTLRFDRRHIFWNDAISDGVDWICRTSGRKPAVPPQAAYDPLYSTWYVFRQTVTQKMLEPELERAAALGMKVVILDDGWQRERGDWQVDLKKFPDLAGHVARAHGLGLKYMLWFALPHVSGDSPAYRRFKDKLISDRPDQWGLYSFDPRFPEVRSHLVRRLVQLMRDYGLDGFKLDFIDNFVASNDDLAVRNGFRGCDCRGMPEASEKLLKEIYSAVIAIRPDALLEFRQRYIGPVVRQYGNMLRSNDCPGDFQANRYRTLALRAISPGSAVHADMLLWRADDTVAELKRQVWSVMFSVVQYSAYLGNLPSNHLSAVRDTIAFTEKHKKTLLHGRIRPHRPECGYPWVEAECADERIIAVYQPECVVSVPSDAKQTILVNATGASSLLVDDGKRIRRVKVSPSDFVNLR